MLKVNWSAWQKYERKQQLKYFVVVIALLVGFAIIGVETIFAAAHSYGNLRVKKVVSVYNI